MISPAMPAMAGGGLSMRMGLFLRSLCKVAQTDLVVLPYGGLAKGQEQLDPQFGAACKIIPVTGREDTVFKFLSRIQDGTQRLEAFRRYGKSSLTAALSSEVKADIAEAVAGKTYDIIHVGRSYLSESALLIKGQSLKTLDADENDAEAYKRRAALELAAGHTFDAAFHLADAEACERQQLANLGMFDAVFASSEREVQSLQRYREGKALKFIPNAVPPPKSILRRDDGATLLFVGSLNFWPNREGLHWFVQQVWPLLKAQRSALRLKIVGRDCPPDIQGLSNIAGISIHPDVENLDEFYADATLAIVPLRMGGGTRIKIIEAAMHGVAVVSTFMGAEGLSFENGQEILLANDAPGMASQITLALDNPSLTRVLSQKALGLAQAQYSFATISHQLACNWQEMLAKRNSRKNQPS